MTVQELIYYNLHNHLGNPLIREGLFIYKIIFFLDAICFKISKISAFILNSANQRYDLVVFSEMQIFVFLYFVLYTLVNSKPMRLNSNFFLFVCVYSPLEGLSAQFLN